MKTLTSQNKISRESGKEQRLSKDFFFLGLGWLSWLRRFWCCNRFCVSFYYCGFGDLLFRNSLFFSFIKHGKTIVGYEPIIENSPWILQKGKCLFYLFILFFASCHRTLLVLFYLLLAFSQRVVLHLSTYHSSLVLIILNTFPRD